jgi:hypothetical protein
MKTRAGNIALVVAVALLLCGLFLSGYAFRQIYEAGGWRDEVYTLVGATATRKAMDDFQQGHLRLYIFGGESDRDRFTGEVDGPFEIWIPRFCPELGSAHRYSTDQFIEFYNRKMRYMNTNSERFLRGATNKVNQVQPNDK